MLYEVITAIGGKTLHQNFKTTALLSQLRIVHRQKTADICHTVLFGTHGAAISIPKQLSGNVDNGGIGVTVFPGFDKPAIFSKTAGIVITSYSIHYTKLYENEKGFSGPSLEA